MIEQQWSFLFNFMFLHTDTLGFVTTCCKSPGKFSKFLYQRVSIKKLVTSDKFCGKVLSRSGVDMLPPRSSQDLRNHTWYKLKTSISTS